MMDRLSKFSKDLIMAKKSLKSSRKESAAFTEIENDRNVGVESRNGPSSVKLFLFNSTDSIERCSKKNGSWIVEKKNGENEGPSDNFLSDAKPLRSSSRECTFFPFITLRIEISGFFDFFYSSASD